MSNNQKFILGFNWKMNPNSLEIARNLKSAYEDYLDLPGLLDVHIFIPSIYASDITDFTFNYGLQDISIAKVGSYTSQISASMSLEFQCQSSLVGHSETRKFMSYDLFDIAKKLTNSLEAGLRTFWCVGYDKSKSNEVDYELLEFEINSILTELINKFDTNILKKKLIIAYEPVWAIGSQKAANPEIINKVLEYIKKILRKFKLSKIPLLYGGSVNSTNFLDLKKQTKVDGYLLGRASLDAQEIKEINLLITQN